MQKSAAKIVQIEQKTKFYLSFFEMQPIFDQYFNQAVSQARVAIRNTINNSEDFEIARPQQNNGKTIIDFVANGGEVILPPDLR